MHLPLSRAIAPDLVELPEVGSTNDELAGRAGAPDFSVLVTASQTAGKGRLGRVWVAPPGKTIAISVLLRPKLPAGEPLAIEHFGWIPLIAGLAMTRAIERVVPETVVSLKWPNDVHIAGLKVAGLLAELLPSGDAVVMGAGVNLTIADDELPTPTSTSLLVAGATAGADELADLVLSGYLAELHTLISTFLQLGADPDASSLRDEIRERCSTVGQQVRVELPNGVDLYGTAVDLDKSGRLIVVRSSDGHSTAVAAGDVTHLRYE
jgi:BirA family transcriptional regulator, biotin operon repressor / biotin---[acetyl-CoA-carboxylase] ligase